VKKEREVVDWDWREDERNSQQQGGVKERW